MFVWTLKQKANENLTNLQIKGIADKIKNFDVIGQNNPTAVILANWVKIVHKTAVASQDLPEKRPNSSAGTQSQQIIHR